MRQKRTILLVDADESSQIATRFLFEIRIGVFVRVAGSLRDGVNLVRVSVSREISLVVVKSSSCSAKDVADFASKVKKLQPEISVVLIVNEADTFTDACVDATMRSPSSAQLLDCVKLLCSRKRGPKPKRAHEILDKAIEAMHMTEIAS